MCWMEPIVIDSDDDNEYLHEKEPDIADVPSPLLNVDYVLAPMSVLAKPSKALRNIIPVAVPLLQVPTHRGSPSYFLKGSSAASSYLCPPPPLVKRSPPPQKRGKKGLHPQLPSSATAATPFDAPPCWTLPYPPHDVQRGLMETLRKAFSARCHAVIESPTGTGKTLALLVASLARHQELRGMSPMDLRAWHQAMNTTRKKDKIHGPILDRTFFRKFQPQYNLKRRGSKQMHGSLPNMDWSGLDSHHELDTSADPSMHVPPIFYCSRTHAQLAQVVRELQKLNLGNVHMNILASRDKFCINPRVKAAVDNDRNNLGEMCDKAVHADQCDAWDNYDAFRSRVGSVPHEWQIEDLVEQGKACAGCPYYAARDLVATAYITFCPYNYLLDPLIRHETKIEGRIRNAIVIFDEGHNIEEVSRSALDVDMRCMELQRAIDELLPFVQGAPLQYSRSFHLGKFTLAQICECAVWLLEDVLRFVAKRSPGTFTGIDLSTALRAEAVPGLFRITLHLFLSLGVTFNPFDAEVASVHSLKKILMLSMFLQNRAEAFTVLIHDPPETFLVFCSDSSLAFQLLAQDVASVVLASGTLPPADRLAQELGVPFPYEFRGGHVVDICKAVAPLVVSSLGRCVHQTMYTESFAKDLGAVVLAAVKASEHGRLLFLPSYALLQHIKKFWDETGITSRIEREGPTVFVEPKDTHVFGALLGKYKGHASRRNGALLVAVYRGKAAEGIDFADTMARVVMCVGVPYQCVTDAKVVAKRTFNDAHPPLSGDAWYLIDASTAVNQALGRCIRHPSDYGAVLLLDERWASPAMIELLPAWIRGAVRVVGDAAHVSDILVPFFSSHRKI